MCIEYNRTLVETDTYLLLCVLPLNASSFVGVEVGVDIGVALIPIKAITLALPFCWADAISYFLSH